MAIMNSTKRSARGIAYAIGLALVGCTLSAPASAVEVKNGTMGFVIEDWFLSTFQSKFADECPEGIAISNDELWWRGMSKQERAAKTNNGLTDVTTRAAVAIPRGPNGENVCFSPTVVKDPPMRTVKGKYSYGANLDGTTDGHATAKSCAHEKFTGVDGTVGVDNQLYRWLGCAHGWRKAVARHVDENSVEGRRTTGLGMILIEVTGVTDPRNSDNVTVRFYRSIDSFSLDAKGHPIPYSSYRIQLHPDGKPRFGDALKGSIKEGVLTTERGDVTLPYYGNYTFIDATIRDMAIRLEISDTAAPTKGLITGYYDLERYLYYLLGQGRAAATTHGDSCPALYDAASRMADGYPDPKTGLCTGISSAFDITASPAFVVRPKASTQVAGN